MAWVTEFVVTMTFEWRSSYEFNKRVRRHEAMSKPLLFFAVFSSVTPSRPCRSSLGPLLLEPCQPLPSVLLLSQPWALLRAAVGEEEGAGPIRAPATRCVFFSFWSFCYYSPTFSRQRRFLQVVERNRISSVFLSVMKLFRDYVGTMLECEP